MRRKIAAPQQMLLVQRVCYHRGDDAAGDSDHHILIAVLHPFIARRRLAQMVALPVPTT